jgi:hypothetical protein
MEYCKRRNGWVRSAYIYREIRGVSTEWWSVGVMEYCKRRNGWAKAGLKNWLRVESKALFCPTPVEQIPADYVVNFEARKWGPENRISPT